MSKYTNKADTVTDCHTTTDCGKCNTTVDARNVNDNASDCGKCNTTVDARNVSDDASDCGKCSTTVDVKDCK